MKVAFLVNDLQLSGGIGVVVNHVRNLRGLHQIDAQLVLTQGQQQTSWQYSGLEEIPVQHIADAEKQEWDIVISTWWETAFSLFRLPAKHYASFVQSIEDRFYHANTAEFTFANLVLDFPVAFITEARWIAETLHNLHPQRPCYFVRNGIDKQTFQQPKTIAPHLDGPLKIVVEGNADVWFKHVPNAILAAKNMKEPHHTTVVTSGPKSSIDQTGVDAVIGPISHNEMAELYKNSHVLIKLSAVEGMYGPPLEAFHMGATCVTTPVTGHDEYVQHGWNALVVDWDDLRGTSRMLDLIAKDRSYLHFLRKNALETARSWPDWQQSSQFMAAALHKILREPEVVVNGKDAQASANHLQAALEVQRLRMAEYAELSRKLRWIDRAKRIPGVTLMLRVRHRLPVNTLKRILQRFGRP